MMDEQWKKLIDKSGLIEPEYSRFFEFAVAKRNGSIGNGFEYNYERYKRYLKIQETKPPVGCDLKAGDSVVYTNDYGAVFTDTVLGFSNVPPGEEFIHLDNDCWWSPVKRESLRRPMYET